MSLAIQHPDEHPEDGKTEDDVTFLQQIQRSMISFSSTSPSSFSPASSRRRQIRNAEIVLVPPKVTTIAAMAGLCGCCGVYNVLAEIASPDDAEWCDSTRRVCVVFEGEVVLSGLSAVAACFGLKMTRVPTNTNLLGQHRQHHSSRRGSRNNHHEHQLQHQSQNQNLQLPFYPSVYLDPAKWRTKKSFAVGALFRVFVSGECPNVGSRKIKPGSEVLVLRGGESLTTSKASQQLGESGEDHQREMMLASMNLSERQRTSSAGDNKTRQRNKAKLSNENSSAPTKSSNERLRELMIATLTTAQTQSQGAFISPQPTAPNTLSAHNGTIDNNNNSNINNAAVVTTLNNSCDELFDEEAFVDDMMYRIHHSPRPLAESFPHQQQIYVGESTVWNRVDNHAFFATMFVGAAATTATRCDDPYPLSQDSAAVVAAARATPRTRSCNDRSSGSGISNRNVVNSSATMMTRSRPQRRVFALCSIGMPEADSVRQVAMRLKRGSTSTSPSTSSFSIANNDVSFVFFVDLPTLHAAPRKFVLETLSALERVIQDNFLCVFLEEEHEVTTSSSSSSKSNINNNNKIKVNEVDVIITCASRFIPSLVRFPEGALFHKVFVRDVRGGQEVLEAASMIVSLNTDLMCSWLIEKFARNAGSDHNDDESSCGSSIPFVKLNDFV